MRCAYIDAECSTAPESYPRSPYDRGGWCGNGGLFAVAGY